MVARKMVLVAVVILVAVACGSSAGVASEFQLRPGGRISAVSLGKTTFEGGITIRCDVTLTGTITSTTWSKIAQTATGAITSINAANCEGGVFSWDPPVDGAWRYVSISGSLPNLVTRIRNAIDRLRARFRVFGGLVECFYEGAPVMGLALATTRTESVYTTGLLTSEGTEIPLHEGGFGCPSTIRMIGTFSFTSQTVTRT
jgi:hypothetical protein